MPCSGRSTSAFPHGNRGFESHPLRQNLKFRGHQTTQPERLQAQMCPNCAHSGFGGFGARDQCRGAHAHADDCFTSCDAVHPLQNGASHSWRLSRKGWLCRSAQVSVPAQTQQVARDGCSLRLRQHLIRHLRWQGLHVPVRLDHESPHGLDAGVRPIGYLLETRRRRPQQWRELLISRYDMACRAHQPCNVFAALERGVVLRLRGVSTQAEETTNRCGNRHQTCACMHVAVPLPESPTLEHIIVAGPSRAKTGQYLVE
jgi:hypothetical protein